MALTGKGNIQLYELRRKRIGPFSAKPYLPSNLSDKFLKFHMHLQDFVCDSMLDIMRGIDRARKVDARIGFAVKALGNQSLSCTAKDECAGFLVEFDVAVAVSEKSTSEKGGAIEIASIVKAGGKRTTDEASLSVSRIKFCVPTVFSRD